MRLPLALLLACCGQSFSAPEQDHATRMAASRELFTGEVRSVLVEHCVKCHGGEKTRSEFDIATRQGLLAGGDQGIAVVLGNPGESPLIDYLRHTEEPYMPPKKPQLPENSIAAIERWIELGAAYDQPLVEGSEKDDGPMQVTDEDRAFWSFAPLKRDFGGKQKIDDFIESGERASDVVLARRLHFDLIGLPPVHEDLLHFLYPDSVDHYDTVVDTLLGSPRFGEKWARHWLDVARFAESHGFEHDYDRKHAFHYRDFVIRAFNDDLPYDQFVKWQLAGDEIAPDQPLAMMATGFLGAGVYPTQITSSEAERVRYDAMDDMLATTGSAMLATTIGCARCHDHKYDPIPTRDYYSMLSAFTTTVRSDVELDLSQLDKNTAAEFATKHKTLEAKLSNYETKQLPVAYKQWSKRQRSKSNTESAPSTGWAVLEANSLTGRSGTVFTKQTDGSHLATGAKPGKDAYTFTTTAPFASATAIRLEALADTSMAKSGPGRAGNGNFQLTDVALTAGGKPVELRNPRATFQQNTGNLSIASALDGDKGTGWAVDPQFGKNHAAIFEIAQPAEIAADAELIITLSFDGNGQHLIGRPRLSISSAPPAQLEFSGGVDPRDVAVEKIQTLTKTPGNEAAILEQFKVLDPNYQKLTADLAALEAERATSKQTVMICSDGNKVKPMRHHTNSGKVPDFYQETYQLNRGDTKQKNDVAELSFLQVLNRANRPASAGRTALADWMVDTESGAGHLLARVIVNRLWQHYFGQGIVATPNDFGFQGERPTHPELLDWLAVQLIEDGWSLKHIHRLIVTSDAYKAERAPRRLQAEAIRDSALAVSGQLDEAMFGPGTLSESTKRRSIYFKVKRSQILPVMQLFDWPDTLTSLGKRAVTTTPSQALVFINNPHMRALAEDFAKRIADAPDPVTAAYRIAYLRLPNDVELATGKAFITAQTHSHKDRNKALADFCGALMSANEFIYVE